MKCPKCGKWNQASLPRCFHCGTALAQDPATKQDWRETLGEVEPAETYITYNEETPPEQLNRQRDMIKGPQTLGTEMEHLKERRKRGAEQLQKLRHTARAAQEALANASIIKPVPEEQDEESTPPRPSPSPSIVPQEPLGRRQARRQQAYLQAIQGDADLQDSMDDVVAPIYESLEPPRTVTQSLVSPRPWEKEVFQYVEDEDAPVLYDGYEDAPPALARDTTLRFSDPLFYEEQRATLESSRLGTATATAYRRRGAGVSRSKTRRGMPFGLRATIWVLLFSFLAVGTTAGVMWAVEAMGMREPSSASAEQTRATIEQVTVDEVPTTIIRIEGTEGTQIFIKELARSFVVTGGYATVEIIDSYWFEDRSDIETDSMSVTLTPYMKYTAGEQIAMTPIEYTINVPLSTARLVRPETLYTNVSTSLSEIRLQVDRGSSVIIDGENVTSLIDANGYVSKIVQVQPIGENHVAVSVRNNHSREHNFVVTLFREPQDIPLEMLSTLQSENDTDRMVIIGQTMPGATVSIESPHVESSLDVSSLDDTGLFSFTAYFPHIGDNEVIVRAQYPDREDSIVTHIVYYMPNADVYTRKAWPMDTTNYTDYVNNVKQRKNTIYLCTGTITDIIIERPQMAIIDVGTEGIERPIMVENSTKTNWEVGKKYDLYADGYGLYGTMPRLTARYTYTIKDAADATATPQPTTEPLPTTEGEDAAETQDPSGDQPG